MTGANLLPWYGAPYFIKLDSDNFVISSTFVCAETWIEDWSLENVECERRARDDEDANVIEYINMVIEIITEIVTTDIQILFFIILLNLVSSIIIHIHSGTRKLLSLKVKVYVEYLDKSNNVFGI